MTHSPRTDDSNEEPTFNVADEELEVISAPPSEEALSKDEGSLEEDTSVTLFKGVKINTDALPHDEEEDESFVEELTEEPAAEEAIVEPFDSERYFDEDEEFLEAYDQALVSDKDKGLVQQLDNVVSWQLLNFYDENGKRKNKWLLANDPPVFRIESSSGEYADFVLTKKLSEQLAVTFENVHRGYYNLSEKKKKDPTASDKGAIERALSWAGENQLKVGGTVIVFALLLVYLLSLI